MSEATTETSTHPEPTMSELIELAVVNGIPTTTSRDIAERFDKRHDNVLQSIERLECSKEFAALNFQGCAYKGDNGKLSPMYAVTKDGFMFLAMGFTGKEAATWKERFIAAFNAMERQLIENAAARQVPKPDGQLFLSHRVDIFVAADRSFRASIRSSRQAGLNLPMALRRANQITIDKTGIDMLAELRAEDHVTAMEAADSASPHGDGYRGARSNRSGCSVIAFHKDWFGGKLGLPYQSCASEQVYRAYSHWCKLTGVRYTYHHSNFTQRLLDHCQARIQVMRIRNLHPEFEPGEFDSKRMFLVSEPPQESPGAWATELVVQFEKHLRVYLGVSKRELQPA